MAGTRYWSGVTWDEANPEVVTLRKIGRLVGNLDHINEYTVNGRYADGATVTKHGFQRGWKTITAPGGTKSFSGTVNLDTTTDGIRFTATPSLIQIRYAGVSPNAKGYGSGGVYYQAECAVYAATSSSFGIVFRWDDNSLNIPAGDYAFRWVAYGPVGGI